MTLKEKIKTSTTLIIVLFSMVFLIYCMVLQHHIGKEVSYMGDAVSYVFYVLLSYVGKEAVVKGIGEYKK